MLLLEKCEPLLGSHHVSQGIENAAETVQLSQHFCVRPSAGLPTRYSAPRHAEKVTEALLR